MALASSSYLVALGREILKCKYQETGASKSASAKYIPSV